MKADQPLPDAGLFEEITKLNNELVNLQRELTLNNIELRRLNELKNRFLGIAAHDLRNPASVIVGFSEMLMGELGGSLSASQSKMLSIIRESGDFILRMLDDLVDFSTIESGQLQLNKEPADLRAIVDRHVELNRIAGARKNIGIRHVENGPVPMLNLDADKIGQVLNNLISNAIKFSKPNTRVTVGITVSPDEVTVSVADEGPGIPAGEMDRLFKPFERTSVKATAGERSTGLGLSISRTIVTGHGGKIWAESSEGAGSTFYFTIPLDPR